MKLTIFMRKISESLFDVIGKKMCIEQPLKMLCGSSKTNRHLRNAYLADPRGFHQSDSRRKIGETSGRG